MERITQMLNTMAASTLLVTGVYMQVAFDDLLTPVVRAVIGIGVLLYFFGSMGRISLTVPDDVLPVSGPRS
jgi:hypothetical protein